MEENWFVRFLFRRGQKMAPGNRIDRGYVLLFKCKMKILSKNTHKRETLTTNWIQNKRYINRVCLCLSTSPTWFSVRNFKANVELSSLTLSSDVLYKNRLNIVLIQDYAFFFSFQWILKVYFQTVRDFLNCVRVLCVCMFYPIICHLSEFLYAVDSFEYGVPILISLNILE